MERCFRTYLFTLGGVVLAGVAVLLLLNLLVDPLGGYPAISLRAFQRYRAEIVSRPAKAELAARGDFDTLIIGSSRVRAGIPVRHPAYGSARVCNLGLGGTTLSETSGVLDFALRHNPVKRVILAADFHMFSASRTIDPTYEISRFNPHLAIVEYHCRNLLGAHAAGESWSIVWNWWRAKPPPAGEDGFAPKSLPRAASQREIFAKRVRESLTAPGAEGSFVRSVARLETFREMVRRCRRDGIELIVFIPPVHALQLETIAIAKHGNDFEQWKRDLVRILAEENATQIVPLWDFTGFTGPMAETVPPADDKATRMKWYLEMSHFTPALGEFVLERLLVGPAHPAGIEGEFGTRLTPVNIEQHLLRMRNDRAAYVAKNSDEIAWLNRIAAQVKGASIANPADL